MTTTYKVLGQSAPSATTLTTLYTVPASTAAACTTLAICNRSTSTTFRVAVRPAGASIANAHYLIYDATIGDNVSNFMTLTLYLQTTDVVSVYAGSANMSFSLIGAETA